MSDIRDCIKSVIENSVMKQSYVAEKMGLTSQKLYDIMNKRRKMEANELLDFLYSFKYISK